MPTLQQRINTACKENDAVQFYDSYSGRSMYGRACVGIVGSRRDCMKVISVVMQDIAAEAVKTGGWQLGEWFDTLLDFDMDNMGRDMILYWPNLATETTVEHDDKDSY